MERIDLIRKIKMEIVRLSARQVLIKRARKTKLPEAERSSIRERLGKSPDWDARMASAEAAAQRVRITALLNFYHKTRGSAPRHGIRKGTEWAYRREWEALETGLLKA